MTPEVIRHSFEVLKEIHALERKTWQLEEEIGTIGTKIDTLNGEYLQAMIHESQIEEVTENERPD